MQLGIFLREKGKGIKHRRRSSREVGREEKQDPKWLDWTKMAGEKREHLSVYTVILTW